jgi:glycosyltransferase involved in cell wall biosynthesis
MIHPHDIYSSSEPWTVRIVYLAKEFVKKGHRVKIAYFPLPQNKYRPSKLEDGTATVGLSRRPGIHNLIYNTFKLYKMAKWADVVHFQKCFYHASLPAIIAALLSRRPIHYDWDDWELKIYEASTQPCILTNFIRGFLKILESIVPQIVDTVSCASKRLKIECEKLGVDKGRIFDAHVGAELARFRPDISGESIRNRFGITKPLVLYLGQLHGGQYVELFIEAAFKLVDDFKKDVSFMIVGDGYRAKELKELAYRFNLNGKVVFTGGVPHELVPQYIAAADVCVACFEENEVTLCKSPLKIVEYLASGKAVVASNVGEVPNMLGEAGVLTLPGNAKSLAAGINRVLEDDRLRKDLEILARQRAEKECNWTITAKNLLEAYKEAIKIN